MLQHISQTKVMRQFSGCATKSPPGRTNNVIPFPAPVQGSTIRSLQPVEADWKERPITKRQFGYIRLLAKKNGISITVLNDRCFRHFGADLSTIKRPEASDVIQALKRRYSNNKRQYEHTN